MNGTDFTCPTYHLLGHYVLGFVIPSNQICTAFRNPRLLNPPMAGGSYPKSSSHKPPPPPSSLNRKSRWASSSRAAATTTSKNNSSSSNRSPDPKSFDPKHNKPPSNPAPPKPVGTQSAATHSKLVAPGQVQPPRPPPVEPLPFPELAVALGQPPPPSYGFHALDRRSISLADGSVRSYFALPPDYQDLPHPMPPPMLGVSEMGGYARFPPNAPMSPGGFRDERDFWNPMMGPGEGSSKRKYRAEEDRQRHFLNPNGYPMGPGLDRFSAGTSSPFSRGGDEMRASKYMRIEARHGNVKPKHLEVDQAALKKKFLHFVKVINENMGQRRTYLEDGKQGRIQCVACGRFGEIGLVLFFCCYCVFITLVVVNILLRLLMRKYLRWFQLLMWWQNPFKSLH